MVHLVFQLLLFNCVRMVGVLVLPLPALHVVLVGPKLIQDGLDEDKCFIFCKIF